MKINPIVFYEVLLNSMIDKVYEFNDTVIYYNIVIPMTYLSADHVILKLIKKGNVAVMFINDTGVDSFPIEKLLEEKFQDSTNSPKKSKDQLNRSQSIQIIHSQEELNIDYIVFMLCNKGLEHIEDTVFNNLWTETLRI